MAISVRKGTLKELWIALVGNISLTYVSTPTHGYLKVSKKNFKETKFPPSEISPFSGISTSHILLEEDCDAPKFIKFLETEGFKFTIKTVEKTRVNTTHNYSPHKL